MPSDERVRQIAMRVSENSFAALCRAFKSSEKFRAYAPASQALWGRELAFASRPDTLGAVTLDQIRPALVQGYLNGWADKPGKQAAALAAFHILEKWAVVLDLLSRPITMGVTIGKMEGGHTPWTAAQVALAEQHARPDIARAITLGANTGQRGSDLVRMGPTDLETFNGIQGITVIQVKTGREVWVPIMKALETAMATWGPTRHGPWLRTPEDSPWTRIALSSAWTYERDHNPALAPLKFAGLVMHGLRGHACVRLYRDGATTKQVADMVGMSEPMVVRYTKKSVQRENASAAVYHLERTIKERSVDKSNK